MAYNDQTEFLRGQFYDAAVTAAVTVDTGVIRVGRVILTAGASACVVTFREVDDAPVFFTVKVPADRTVVFYDGVRYPNLEVLSDNACAIAINSFND